MSKKYIDADETKKQFYKYYDCVTENTKPYDGHTLMAYEVADMIQEVIDNAPAADVVKVVRCKDCKHNPKDEWFGCPMSHLSEKQRPETAWCWRGEERGLNT